MSNFKKISQEEIEELFCRVSRDHQDGRLEEAMQGYRDLLTLFPEAPILHYNQGLALLEMDRQADARDAFLKAVQLQPEDTDALFNLAVAKKNLGETEEAIDTYLKLLAQDPSQIDAWYNLGGCYRERHDFASAEKVYLELLERAPEHDAAVSNLAFVYISMPDHERAIVMFRRLLELRPDDEAATHMLAALTGDDVNSVPVDYVRSIFDKLADNFEEKLQDTLGYRAPEQIRQMLLTTFGSNVSFECALDLGCGTGLGAEALLDLCTIWDGLDLSPEMIAQARQKSIFRKLMTGNFIDILPSRSVTYDFILAADVFAYLGDLDQTFTILHHAGKPGALLCFSTELSDDDGFNLQVSGRFSHSYQYVVDSATANGWQLVNSEAIRLRKERDQWLRGTLWLFKAV